MSRDRGPWGRTAAIALLIALGLAPAAAAPVQDLRGVTEDGRKVLLSPDGKWRFDTAARPAATPPEQGSPYQTGVKRFSVSFNTADWTLQPRREGDESNKRTFQHKRLPMYGMVIADEMPAHTEAMKNVITGNAQSAGASITVLLDQIQQISGKDVGSLRMAAAFKGMEFVYATYYYADEDGNIQVTCYTAQALFFKYQADCEKFQNGLTIKPRDSQ